MGAEYAYGAVQNGLSIRVAYLTCSGPHPDTEISHTRTLEALTAWSTLGVPKENFTFLNLSQSAVGGPPSYSDADIARAKDVLKMLILSLPLSTAVLVPAQCESHVDHRTIRKACLDAIIESNRLDLLVYETPEYNSFISLLHCPRKTIRLVLRHVPLLNRFIKPYMGPSNFVNGPPGYVFGDIPNRVAKKLELLKFFSSQNSDLLIHLFGYETLYRPLSLADHPQEQNVAPCVPALGGRCDPSAATFGIAILVMTFLTAYEFARAVRIVFSNSVSANHLLLVLGFVTASAYVVRRIRRIASLESALLFWAVSLGLIIAVL
jgi:LmbE family N-acetylglucosaminyl deacetylase